MARMNDVAFKPKAISSALRALTNAATLSRARAIIASTSRECLYGPPRCTLRASRWSVTAARTVAGICAPAALSKKTKRSARSSAGNRRRTSSTGNRSGMGLMARARVDNGHQCQKRQKGHDAVLQSVHEKRRGGNRRQRGDAEPRRRAMRGHPDGKPRELVGCQRRSEAEIGRQNDHPDEEHTGHRGAVEREK